ncbi:MAG: B12-binding domain-containing radical SAM protein [Candidatus Scalinduaceae bacterium]
MNEFKVLLVYANSMMDNLIPLSVSYLIACLKEKGIQVRLFDTTFYKTAEKSSDDERAEMLQVKPVDMSEYGINYKTTNMLADFRDLVIEYRPQLIGFSVVEPTYTIAYNLLNSIRDIKGKSKVIFGGIYSIFAYNKIIKNPLVDMVCYGEGEETIVKVCRNISANVSLKDLENLVIKEDGQIFVNRKSSLSDLNKLPNLDFSLYEKERFYKPVGGRVLKMAPVEFSRGCPYTCTYCADPALTASFKESGRWFRQKDNKRTIDEIECYLKEYNIEYFYFISESFLSMGEKKFNEFIEYYKSIKIPFWFNTRIETISHEKLEKLETINCNRISIGLESGSEYIRKKLLRRNYSNDYFLEKFRILSEHNISVSVNNIIGFPDETREQIFETIDLNRNIKAESFGAYIFQPYQGTSLRDYCVRKGYIPEDYLAEDVHFSSGLTMPQITREEIGGLQRTFTLYTKLPKEYYDDIKIAERFDKEGNGKFKELSEIYYQEYA